jgi:beta-glucanase (GH16 family)
MLAALSLAISAAQSVEAAASPSFTNASFESPQVGSYSSTVSGSGWAFAGYAGIQHNGSAYSGATSAPNGSQTAFIQGLNGRLGTMTQDVVFPGGTFTIGFAAARRWGSVQPVRVSVDGTAIGTYSAAGASFAPITTARFTVTAGVHSIRFAATDGSSDRTTFIDSVAIMAATTTPPAASGDIDLTNYALTFSDEFSALSATATTPKGSSRWYAYPPYGPAGNYSASTWNINAFSASNGILSNRAYVGSNPGTLGNYWNSGNLSSVDTSGAGFSQKYGYFEARVKMPDSGRGAWPAFWLSTTNTIPAVSSKPAPHVEIDIFEWYGVTNTVGSQQALIQQASHNWKANGTQDEAVGTFLYSPQTPMPGGAFPWKDFHTYGVQVDAAHITWYIDGVQTNRIATPAAYMTSPFYLMVDYALGGGWDLSGMVNGSVMQVDWVRVYALPSSL